MLIEAELELAGLLWQFARDVHLWSAQPPGERDGLFAPLALRTRRQVARGAEEYPVLRWTLRTLEAMVSAPAVARANDVALACTKLAEWADAHHLSESALQFAEAAAIAQPGDAQLAAVAGSACARVADVARAEVWFRRAIRLGSRNHDWQWYTRGYIRLANLVYEIGEYPLARKYYKRARWAGRWRGWPAYAGQAAHGMLTVAIHRGSYAEAERLALQAAETYPANHERIPHLAHDFAYLLLRHAWFSRAAKILATVSPQITRPSERIVVMGSTARAAAGMGDAEAFEQAAQEVELLAEISTEGASMAFVHLAEGYASFGDWDQAERAVSRAIEISLRRGEQDNQRQAAATLERIRSRAPALSEPTSGGDRVDAAVATMLARLHAQFDPAQRPGAPAISTSELPVLTTPSA